MPESKPSQNLKILFFGDHYYPAGGILDFAMIGTKQECLDKFREICLKSKYGVDWGQIADHATMELEYELKDLRQGKVEVKEIGESGSTVIYG